MEQLESKLQDYKNYSVVLAAISTFLYIGLFLKGGQLSNTNQYILIAAMTISLIFALLFFGMALGCKKKLNDIDDD
jgi:bacteriorhodopsin